MKKINLEALKAGLTLKYCTSGTHEFSRIEDKIKDTGIKNAIFRFNWKYELSGVEQTEEFKKYVKKVDIEKVLKILEKILNCETVVLTEYSTSWYLFDIYLNDQKEIIDLRQKKKEISNSYCPDSALKDELKEPGQFNFMTPLNIKHSLKKCIYSKGGQKIKVRIFYKWEDEDKKEYCPIFVSSENLEAKFGDIEKAIRFFQAREDGIIKVYEDNKGIQRLDYYISKKKLFIDLREKKEEVEEIKEIQEVKEAVVADNKDENLRNVIFNFRKEEGKEVVVKVWRGKKALFSDKVKVENIKEVDNAIKANFKVWKSIQKTGASELLIWLSF